MSNVISLDEAAARLRKSVREAQENVSFNRRCLLREEDSGTHVVSETQLQMLVLKIFAVGLTGGFIIGIGALL